MSAPDKITTDEMMESLTGYDEIAIEKAFNEPWQALGTGTKQTFFLRALVFISLKRQGKNDAQAKEAVLSMSLKEVQDYFADEPEDLDPEQPESESGKDDSEPA